VIENKERKIKEEPDLVLGSGRSAKKYKLDLIPPHLMIARFFPEQQARIEELRAQHEAATCELEEFVEEHEGEEDLLSEVKNDQGKVSKGEITKRLKALKGEPDSEDEVAALQKCKQLIDAEATVKKAIKDAEAELKKAVLARYGDLTKDEIETLVIDDKWLADIRKAIDDKVQRVTNQLAGRVRELEERYAETLPTLEQEVKKLASRVAGHLDTMGVQTDA
jgi:type I restriction enzyme M protein